MKHITTAILLTATSLTPLWASVTINTQFGRLRDTTGTVITSTTTTYAIVYDTNNDSQLPGDLGLDASLTAADSSAAFNAFSGVTLSQGLVIGGDTVVKWGTFNDQDGVAFPILQSADFTASGLTETAGRNYAFY